MAQFLSSASDRFIVWNMECEFESDLVKKLCRQYLSRNIFLDNQSTSSPLVRGKLAHHAQNLGLVIANDRPAVDPVNSL